MCTASPVKAVRVGGDRTDIIIYKKKKTTKKTKKKKINKKGGNGRELGTVVFTVKKSRKKTGNSMTPCITLSL